MTGIIQTNPCKRIKPSKIVSPEKGILTRQELQKFFSEENQKEIWPETIHFIFNYLAANIGLRLGEILASRPKNVSNDQLIISHSYDIHDGLKSTKNGKKRIIPVNEKLKLLLSDLCKEMKPEQYIFSYNNGLKPMDHKSVYIRFLKALETIGISREERKKGTLHFTLTGIA
jgi:integrase